MTLRFTEEEHMEISLRCVLLRESFQSIGHRLFLDWLALADEEQSIGAALAKRKADNAGETVSGDRGRPKGSAARGQTSKDAVGPAAEYADELFGEVGRVLRDAKKRLRNAEKTVRDVEADRPRDPAGTKRPRSA